MNKFKGSLFNKFKDFKKDSASAGWESFKAKNMGVTPLSNKFSGFEKDTNSAGWDAFSKKASAASALSNKFEGFEKNTSGAEYQEFNNKKKRKAAIVFWLVKVPLMIGLLVVAYYTNLKRENPLINMESRTSDYIVNKERSIQTVEPTQESNLAISDNLGTKEQRKEELLSSAKLRTIVSSNYKGNKRNKGVSRSNAKDAVLTAESTIPNGTESAIGTQEQLGEQEGQKTLGAGNGILGGLGNQGKVKDRSLYSDFVSIETIGLNLLTNPFEKRKELDFDPDFIYKKPSQWSLSIKAGANVTTSRIVAKPGSEGVTNKNYKRKTEEAETPAMGYSFELAAEYRYLQNISFKAGLGYSKHSIGGTYVHGLDSVPFVDIDGTIYYLPPNKDSLNGINRSDAGYTYSYLNIPIGLVYRLPINTK